MQRVNGITTKINLNFWKIFLKEPFQVNSLIRINFPIAQIKGTKPTCVSLRLPANSRKKTTMYCNETFYWS